MIDELEVFQKENKTELMKSNEIKETGLSALENNLKLNEDLSEYYGYLYMEGNVSYSYFKQEIAVQETVIKDGCAIIDVIVFLDYQYIECDEPTYEEHHYSISLIKTGDQWLIAEVVSDDLMYQIYCNDSFDLEKEQFAHQKARSSVKTPTTHKEQVITAALGANETISYNAANAINYALTYSTQSDDNTTGVVTYRNSNFYWETANCMNFVSQCFWAGIGGSNSALDIANFDMMDRVGNSTAKMWYGNLNARSSSWISCSGFRTYLNDAKANNTGLICNTYEIAEDDEDLALSVTTLKGAAIQGRGLSNGQPVALGHVVFVNNATGSERSQIWITAYNRNWKNKRLDQVYGVTSGAINRLLVIKPVSLKRSFSCNTALFPNHNFSAGSTVCNSCGYNKMILSATLHNATAVNTTLTLNGKSNLPCTKIELSIKNPNGANVTGASSTNSTSVSKSVKMNVKGTWTITVKGTDSTNNIKTYTYIVRVV